MSDPTREAAVAAILHGRFFPGTTHDVGDDDCACETAAVLAALSTTPAPDLCPECAHPLTEHQTPGGECVHAFCTHDQSFEIVTQHFGWTTHPRGTQ